MKVIIVVCLIFAIGHAALDPAFKDRKMKELLEDLNECEKKEAPTKQDLQEMFKDKPLTRKGAKCTWACLHETHGVIDKHGKLNLEGALRFVDDFKVDADIFEKLKQAYTKCIEKVGDPGDRCETAGKFFECNLSEFKEVGLPYNFLEA